MRKAKHSPSSSPPEFLPTAFNDETQHTHTKALGIPNESGRIESGRTASTSSSCSSILSTTPPSSIPKHGHSEETSSRSSSLSASPVTPPKKTWERIFKSKIKEPSDDCSSSNDSNHLNTHRKNRSRYSSSLPRNYMYPLPLLTPNQLSQGSQLIPPRATKKLFNQDPLDISHLKFESEDYLSGESDLSNNSPSNRIGEVSKRKQKRQDKSTRGGNVFGSLFSRGKSKKGSSAPRGMNRFMSMDNLEKASIAKQQQKHLRNHSDDMGLKKKKESIALEKMHRLRSMDNLENALMSRRKPQRNRQNTTFSDDTGPKHGRKDGTVMVHDGFNFETKEDANRKKKLVFIEVRNSVNVKDSSTAYLGEEKSIHRGKNFAPNREFHFDTALNFFIVEPFLLIHSYSVLIHLKKWKTHRQVITQINF